MCAVCDTGSLSLGRTTRRSILLLYKEIVAEIREEVIIAYARIELMRFLRSLKCTRLAEIKNKWKMRRSFYIYIVVRSVYYTRARLSARSCWWDVLGRGALADSYSCRSDQFNDYEHCLTELPVNLSSMPMNPDFLYIVFTHYIYLRNFILLLVVYRKKDSLRQMSSSIIHE